jgi:hypothetical protein
MTEENPIRISAARRSADAAHVLSRCVSCRGDGCRGVLIEPRTRSGARGVSSIQVLTRGTGGRARSKAGTDRLCVENHLRRAHDIHALPSVSNAAQGHARLNIRASSRSDWTGRRFYFLLMEFVDGVNLGRR